jgi:hypothetical protein
MAAFKISIKATVGGCSDDEMVQNVRAVARQLDEVQRNTSRFLAFTLSSDRPARLPCSRCAWKKTTR